MQTAELIAKLGAETASGRHSRIAVRLLGPLAGGAAVSFLLMWTWLGIRPDLAEAIRTSAYWMKFAYTLWLATAAFWLAERLGRPGTRSRWPLLLAALAVLFITGLAAIQLTAAPSTAHARLLMGSSSSVCPWRIAALSLPILAGAVFGLRRLAPTRLIMSGAASGFLAGAAGAWIYAFHCDESAAPFIAVWYTLAIAAIGTLGSLSGKWLLRW